METKKRKIRKTSIIERFILFIIFLISISLFIYSLFHISLWYKDTSDNKKIKKKLESDVMIIDAESGEVKIDFDHLESINSDTIGYIVVNNTSISYPIVQTNDNEYYLNKNFNKEYNDAGWIFADFRNKFDGTDKNIIIYGHSMLDGSMFGSLHNTMKKEWYSKEDNLIIKLYTKEKTINYKVISLYTIEAEDYYITTDFTYVDYNEFLNTIINRSNIDFNEVLNSEDKILTLSTCAYDGSYRMVLHAKKIEEEINK